MINNENNQATISAEKMFSTKSFAASSFQSAQKSTLFSSSSQQSSSMDSMESMFDTRPPNFSKLSIDDNKPFKSSLLQTSFDKDLFERDDMFSQMRNKNNLSGFTLTQTQASHVANASVTRMVSNKMMKKKVTRTIVNGKVVEEEEEIDEVENEPITEQYVFENRQDLSKVNLNIGGKNFDMGKSQSCPAVTNDDGKHRKNVKAIEGPTVGSKIKNFFLGRKKEEKKNFGKTKPIIEELLKTEENYVNDLKIIVEDFMTDLERSDAPGELKGENRDRLFGEVEKLYMFHDVEFLPELRDSHKNPDDIAICFLKHRKHFKLYRHFNRNQPNAEKYLGKYESFFKRKQEEIKSSLDLRSYLIKPTQRLCRYILLMKEIARECEKHNVNLENVTQTVDMLEAEIRLGNDLMALDAIKNCDMDLRDQGDLIRRNQFSVKKGVESEYTAMIFLFEKIILFTKIVLENNVDINYYQDFIYLKDIGLTEKPDHPQAFEVWFHKHTLKPYNLKTTDKKIKEMWVSEIRKHLQNELDIHKKENGAKKATLIDLKNIDEQKVDNRNKINKCIIM